LCPWIEAEIEIKTDSFYETQHTSHKYSAQSRRPSEFRNIMTAKLNSKLAPVTAITWTCRIFVLQVSYPTKLWLVQTMLCRPTLFDSQHQTEVILFSWPVWLTRHWNEIGSMELASNTLQESWSSIMIGQCLVHYNIMESELVWQLRTIKVRGPAMHSQFWFGSWKIRLHIA